MPSRKYERLPPTTATTTRSLNLSDEDETGQSLSYRLVEAPYQEALAAFRAKLWGTFAPLPDIDNRLDQGHPN